MNKNSAILITGSEGMVGKNLVNELKKQKYKKLILINKSILDLSKREDVFKLFEEKKPEYVIHLASKVGGIKENKEKPVEFLRENILINVNVIDACFFKRIKKLIFLNSSTIYPSKFDFPSEKNFFNGNLEKENEAYALSKVFSIKLCDYYNKEYKTNFINLISPNIYGKYAKFNSQKSNVIAALITRFHYAKKNNLKEVYVWGSGNAIREFIFAKDLSKLIILSMKKINSSDCIGGILNCGINKGISIREISNKIKEIVGFKGKIIFDLNKPEGVLKRTLDSSRFKKRISLKKKTLFKKGLNEMYGDYLRR